MRKMNFLFAGLLVLAVSVVQFGQTPETPRYQLPPQEIMTAFDAQPLPTATLSPTKQMMVLSYRRANPTIAELAQPMLRLAGARVNPKTNGPHRTANVYALTLKKIADGTEVKVTVPAPANISNVHFSPDGTHLSFLNTKDNGIELWLADVATGKARLLSGADRLNATTGDPCDWLKDNKTLVCQMVSASRGPAPAEPTVPVGPNVQETSGKAAPAATYEDMIKTAHDEALFEYYFTSQLAAIDIATGHKSLIGRPAIFDSVTPSPGGDYLLVTKIKRPFSHLIPLNGFPQDVEVWSRAGQMAKKIADVPTREGVSLTGVQAGPRGIRWRPDQPATVIWTEALDGGDLKPRFRFATKSCRRRRHSSSRRKSSPKLNGVLRMSHSLRKALLW
jgi:dipeptidyl aminopeptidase/acylaminoacyl peptidase